MLRQDNALVKCNTKKKGEDVTHKKCNTKMCKPEQDARQVYQKDVLRPQGGKRQMLHDV